MIDISKNPSIKQVIRDKIKVLKDFYIITTDDEEQKIRVHMHELIYGCTYNKAIRSLDIYCNSLISKKLESRG